ncbi:hypothetical protein [Oligoflexus tunisiensis]|uniref:hypothetical protein n=1 Tax=Oligoflexus tunisiensis TaxID=708132 RepID=UPI00114D062B|nr:hypothetical protein [Oligoflexus tunisiensis]
MKKGKTTLAAMTLGALTYLAWLGLDIKNPEKPAPVATPYEVVSETVAPVMPEPAPAPRRVVARKSVKVKKAKASEPAPVTTVDETPSEEKKSTAEVPMPKVWEGTFVKLDRPYKDECDIDRPCSPRGRDGVLLVGVSFSLNGWKPMMPEVLAVGSYQQRTPLLVYK